MENLTDAVAHVAPELQMPGGEATVGTQIQCAPGTQGDKVLVHYVAGNFLVFDPYAYARLRFELRIWGELDTQLSFRVKAKAQGRELDQQMLKRAALETILDLRNRGEGLPLRLCAEEMYVLFLNGWVQVVGESRMVPSEAFAASLVSMRPAFLAESRDASGSKGVKRRREEEEEEEVEEVEEEEVEEEEEEEGEEPVRKRPRSVLGKMWAAVTSVVGSLTGSSSSSSSGVTATAAAAAAGVNSSSPAAASAVSTPSRAREANGAVQERLTGSGPDDIYAASQHVEGLSRMSLSGGMREFTQEEVARLLIVHMRTTEHDELRCRVFLDLWSKGYYVSRGVPFGGDFLVYPGPPVTHHSHFIAVVLPYTTQLQSLDIIAHSRLGTSTKKVVLMCSGVATDKPFNLVRIAHSLRGCEPDDALLACHDQLHPAPVEIKFVSVHWDSRTSVPIVSQAGRRRFFKKRKG